MADKHVLLIRCAKDRHVIDMLETDISGACSANGGQLVSLRWTTGAYDAVAVIELAGRLVPILKLDLEDERVSSVVVLRAFEQQEAHDALGDWVEFATRGR